MSPAIIHTANFSACPDWTAAAGPIPGYFKLEGAKLACATEGFDTATRPVLVNSLTPSAIAAAFPLGQAHPRHRNLLLTGRGDAQELYGTWTELTLTYKGIAHDSFTGAPSTGIRAFKAKEWAKGSEKTFPTGVGGLPDFPSYTSGWPTRVRFFDYGYSLYFVSQWRMTLPSIYGSVLAPLVGSFPTVPAWPWSTLPNPTRVYPYGWSVADHDQEQIPGTDYYTGEIHYTYQYQYQPG